MMKVEVGCYYVITTNVGEDFAHTEVVEVKSVEKEKDGKRFVALAKGRTFVSLISDMIVLYPYDNNDWHSYVGQLMPQKDKKKDVRYGERGAQRLAIKMLFEFSGKSITLR